MTSVDEFTRLKGKVDKLKKKKERAEGALEQLLKRMCEVTGASTIEKGRELLSELEQKAKKAEVRYDRALESFVEEWGEKLEEVE